MKKFILLLGCCLLVWGTSDLWAQQGFVAIGGQSDGTGGNVSFSIGQMNYLSATGTGGSINEGLQQPEGSLGLYGTLTYDNTMGTVLNNTTVLLMQGMSVIDQAVTDLSGYYRLSNPAAGTYTLDANCSKPWGSGNATDALLILQDFVGAIPLAGLRLAAADVNLSGVVNAADALGVLKRFVGLQSSFPAGDWLFEHPEIVVTGSNSQTVDFKGICYGDVDGSYEPSARMVPTLFLANNGVKVIQNEQVVDLPVTVSQPLNCAAVSLVLDYPAEAFNILGVEAAYDNQTLVYNAAGNQLRIGWYTLQPVSLKTGDLLLTIRVKVKASASLASLNLGFEVNAESSLADLQGTEILNKTLNIPGLVSGDQGFSLGQNMPNPFSNNTQIGYVLPEDGFVKLELLDLVGQQIAVITDNLQEAGSHQVTFDGSSLRKGIYFYRMTVTTEAQQYSQTKRMVISR